MRGAFRIGKSAALALLLLIFWFYARSAEAAPESPPYPSPDASVPATEPSQPQSAIGLPCPIPGAPLVAQALALYEGPFWEDGLDCETVCAGLLVTNLSDVTIEYAQILCQQNGQTLCFEITYFPPGSDLLVLEADQAPFSDTPVENLRCVRLSYCEDTPRYTSVYVSAYGACSMIATNLTDTPIEAFSIFYKHYFPEDDLYIGGITYRAVLNDLNPGESRRITPYHFLSGQSKILFAAPE